MPAVIEIRTYTLKAGSGAEFQRIFVEEALPMLRRWGVEVVASARRWTTTTPST